MSTELESGFYQFRYSYREEDGSLAVDFAVDYITNKKDLFRYMDELKQRLKVIYDAREPFNITYKRV